MDKINKYNKYKIRYLNLKNNDRKLMNGGGLIKYENLDFLKDWEKINTMGQNNCGIYLSDKHPKRILKCVTSGTSGSTITEVNKLLSIKNYHIFPDIHNIYEKENGNSFVEMEKFDGDITDFLYKIIPKMILDELNVTDEIKQDLWKAYRCKIPKTMDDDESLKVYLDDITIYLYNNRDQIKTFIRQFNNHDFSDNNDFIFNNIKVNKYIRPKMIIENIIKLIKINDNFKDSKISYNQYEYFMKRINEEIIKYLPKLRDQIIMLKICLLEINFKYIDNKLDNFAYVLSDNPIKHLDKNWKNNKIGDKYFYVYIIDWDSGLFELSNDIYYMNRIIDEFNGNLQYYTKYGQYNMNSIGSKLFNLDENIMNLPNEILKILNTKFELNLDIPKSDVNTIKQLIEKIN